MPVSITFPVLILSEIDDRSHIYQIIWAYDFPDRLFQRLLVNAIDNLQSYSQEQRQIVQNPRA